MTSWSIRRLEDEHPCVPWEILDLMVGRGSVQEARNVIRSRMHRKPTKSELTRAASIRRYEEEHGVSLTEGYINER